MEKLLPTPDELAVGDATVSYETWVDGVDPATVEAIKAGAKFRVLDDWWTELDTPVWRRVLLKVELV